MSDTGRLPVPLPRDAAPGVYVHIPFCRYICPYCDFNVYARQEDLIPEYIDAICRELELRAASLDRRQPAPTLFIGGGTPSLLPTRDIVRIIEAVDQVIGLEPDAEITMESNPEGLSVGYVKDLLESGVNRLSIGVQTLQPPGLKVLGRLHGAAGALQAFEAARCAGVENLSLDFIYGWPGQTLQEWQDDLESILEWQPEHASLYSLIVEAGTPMARAVERGQLHPVEDDEVAGFYDLAVEMLSDEGWCHYEIANWTRADELRSRHNQIYWQNGRYFGIGAGAHGYLGNVRMSNLRLPTRYIESVLQGALPDASSEVIDGALEMGETMMLGLRLLIDGVSAADFQDRHGHRLSDVYREQITRLIDLGLLEWHGNRLRLTERGAMVSNSVCAEFLP